MSGGLTRKVGIIGVSRLVATSVTVLVVNMFLSRYLDRAVYGTFQQTWFFTHMLIEIALLGFPVGILYILPKLTPAERKGFLVRLTLLLVLIGGALAAALYLLAPSIAGWFHNPRLTGTFRVFALYAFFVLPGMPMDAFLITQNRHRLLGVVTVAHSLLLVAAVLVPAGLGLVLSAMVWWIAGYGLLRGGLLVGSAFSTVRHLPTERREGIFGRFVGDALPVALNDLLRVVARWLDKNIVSAFFNPETFAIYANGAVEIPFVNVIAGAISSVVIPEFSRLSEEGKREEMIALWHRAILKTAAILIPLFAYLMVLATPFIVFLFSKTYEASAGPFRIYLLLLPLRSATYTPILLALGRSRLVALGALIDLLANLGLSIFLIRHFSYLGPAIATVVTTYGQAAFYLWRTGRILNRPAALLFPWRNTARLMMIGLAPALLLLPLWKSGFPPIVDLAVGGLLYFIPYAFLLWRFGPFGEAEKEMVRGLIGKLRR